MEPKLKGNITDLLNCDRKKVATALVKMFSDQAKQAKTGSFEPVIRPNDEYNWS